MSYPAADWRETRREAARAAIVEAAWAAVEDEGLAGLSLRDLAKRAGTTTPTIYKYFASKNDIYDAMFGQAAAEFEAFLAAPYPSEQPRAALEEGVRRFFAFCTSDIPRYQLLFQRTIPGFEPSPESFAAAVRALAGTRQVLARNGVTGTRQVDLWTALTTGLVDQQISNDPGGRRWTRLAEDSVTMFLDHARKTSSSSSSRRRRQRP
ncbi:MAG TPA: TetR/AcrR family transcriptional regulator [Acidimicrobiales bacterium]|nr:TetR/AcrR family transcriptional regulator [Acidimicrobiales bacterium]